MFWQYFSTLTLYDLHNSFGIWNIFHSTSIQNLKIKFSLELFRLWSPLHMQVSILYTLSFDKWWCCCNVLFSWIHTKFIFESLKLAILCDMRYTCMYVILSSLYQHTTSRNLLSLYSSFRVRNWEKLFCFQRTDSNNQIFKKKCTENDQRTEKATNNMQKVKL